MSEDKNKSDKNTPSIGEYVAYGTLFGLACVAGPALFAGATASGILMGIPFSGTTGIFIVGGYVGANVGLAAGIIAKGTSAIVKRISNIVKKRRLNKLNRPQTPYDNQRAQYPSNTQNRTSIRHTLSNCSRNDAIKNEPAAQPTATPKPVSQVVSRSTGGHPTNLDWSGIVGPVRPSQLKNLNRSLYESPIASSTRANRPPSAKGRREVVRG